MKKVLWMVLAIGLIATPAFCDELDDAYHEKYDTLQVQLKSSRAQLTAALMSNAPQHVLDRYSTTTGDLMAAKSDMKIKLLEKNGKLPEWWVDDK